MLASLIASAVLIACGGGSDVASDAQGAAEAPGIVRATAVAPVSAPVAAPVAAATPAEGSTRAPTPAPATPEAGAPAFTPPTATDPGAPVPLVFNASGSARPGDIVSVQGEDFGSAPLVWLEALGSTPATPLPVLNRVGSGWLAVQIPANATGALALRIFNGANTSARVLLNAATPHHLDATQIVPGGAFRVLGRNLLLPASTPVVTVDGLPAAVDLAASDEHLLSVTAPLGLAANAAARILVDNGNGSGPALLERPIRVVTGQTGDPLGLGVGWGAGFAAIAARGIDAASDARLARRVVCDGLGEDSAAIRGALEFAHRNGGGVVRLPAGVCLLDRGVQLHSGTVLQGAGKDLTELRHSGDSAVFAYDADLIALRHLTLSNTGSSAGSSLNLKHSSRVAVQGVRINQGHSAMAWIYGHRNVVVRDSEFLQTGSLGATGAAHLSGNSGLVFTGNRVAFRNNIGTNLDRVSDAFVQGNSFTRDASHQGDPGVVHVLTLNFAHRIALLDNSFRVVGGPVDPRKNDGETILTEGGGARRTEGLGQVATATPQGLFDPRARLNPNVPEQGVLPENYGITIVAGKGAGQSRRVTQFNAGQFTIDRAWDSLPDASSRYATATWGLEQALIRGNTMSDNPRGIVLWSTALREVEIAGNSLQENGGILVRAFQRLADGWFTPVLNVRVLGNRIASAAQRTPAYVSVHFANGDGQAFGMSHVGVEVRRNQLSANSPNIAPANHLGPAEREGYMVQMNVEAPGSAPSSLPRLLGTVLQDNRCSRCATAFRLGSGAAGTMLMGNQLSDSGALWINSATASGSEAAVATWVR